VTSRQDALLEVVDLMTRHGLTLDDVTAAVAGRGEVAAARSSGILSRIFAYLGGIFVFAGLGIYIGMRWDELGPAGRVLLTLGPGFSLFLLALVCTTDERFERAATPLFLVAGAVQPTGILVLLREFSTGGDPVQGLLFMNVVMAIQQACVFWARRRTVLAFTSIVFVTGAFVAAFDLIDADPNLVGVVLGASLLCVGWSLDQSPHRALSGLVYFVGSGVLAVSFYDWVRRTPGEILFLGLACGFVVLATAARSRSLLVVGTVALTGYIVDFLYRNFAGNLNAPLLLMATGLMLIGIGAAAVRINNAYIAQKPGASPAAAPPAGP
jgi:hypothetical protein